MREKENTCGVDKMCQNNDGSCVKSNIQQDNEDKGIFS